MPEVSAKTQFSRFAQWMLGLLRRGSVAGLQAARKFSSMRKVDLERRRLQSQKMDRLLQVGLKAYDLYKSNDLKEDELVSLSESISLLDQGIDQKEREIDAIRLQKYTRDGG